MPDLQRYPLKLWMIKYELDIHVLVSLNWLFSFKASLQKWFARFFLEEMQKSSENDSIFLIFIRVRDLKNSGKYGSGVSCRWVLFTALAFKFKLHLIFHRVEFKKPGLIFYLVDFHGRNWSIPVFYENKTQHWALFSTKSNQGRFYFHRD